MKPLRVDPENFTDHFQDQKAGERSYVKEKPQPKEKSSVTYTVVSPTAASLDLAASRLKASRQKKKNYRDKL